MLDFRLGIRVSLKPDRKTADKTANINSDGRASYMIARAARLHTMSSAHQTVTLLATVAWARVSGRGRIKCESTIVRKFARK